MKIDRQCGGYWNVLTGLFVFVYIENFSLKALLEIKLPCGQRSCIYDSVEDNVSRKPDIYDAKAILEQHGSQVVTCDRASTALVWVQDSH